MVSNAGPDDAVQVTSLEWRRHFYRVGSGPALVGCVVASLIAIIGFTGAVLAAAQWDSHNAVVLIWAGTGLFGSGMAASLIFQSQILPPAMNTVSISNGVTVVRSAGGMQSFVFVSVAMLGFVMLFIGLLVGMRHGVIPQDRRGNVVTVSLFLVFVLAMLIRQLLVTRVGHALEFSPHDLYVHIGETRAEIPWNSIVETHLHRGKGIGHNDGIGLTITDQASVAEPMFTGEPRRLPGAPLPIALFNFSVDEDTLFNVIAAAHSHPEVRQLFGSEEGRVLFDGPSRDLRRTMRRSEVWLPWERGVHAALYPVAPATSDNPGAPEILAPDTAPAPVPATEDTAVPGSADTTLG